MKFTAQPSADDSTRPGSAGLGGLPRGRREGPRDVRPPRRRTRRACVVLSWVAVLAVAALIFWMSAKDGIALDEKSGLLSAIKAWLSGVAQAAFGRPVDVSPIGHFTEYLVFGAALANALRWHLPVRRAALCAVILASLYGVTDEVHQIFVPMRSCDPADWAVDTVAACIGAIAAAAVIGTRKGRG